MNAQAGRDCFVTMFLAMTGAVLSLLPHDDPRDRRECPWCYNQPVRHSERSEGISL